MALLLNSLLGSSPSFFAAGLNNKLTKSPALNHYVSRYASTTQYQGHQFNSHHVVLQGDFEEKKEKMRELIAWREEEDPMERLMFVDRVQRLGVSHHYVGEIERIMKHHYLKSVNGNSIFCGYQSLRYVSLSFRLCRQRGYHVSADMFNNFKGKDGKFRDELKQDIWGLLELYEATQLSFEGESILDEAQDFSRQILSQHLAQNHMNLEDSNTVEMRMRHPYHKSITKITDNNILCQAAAATTTFAELSELDFLRRKHIHNYELLQVCEWWNGLDLNGSLKLARNQPVKWYTWSMAMLMDDDTRLSEQRVQLTKSIAFIYLIDDVFDLYGTLDELELFNEAVHEWDYGAMDMLPDYMKLCYKSLLDTTDEIANSICVNHGYNPIIILKQTWASLCNAFLVEARWLASRTLPRAEEYLANGKVSSGVHVVLIHLFFLLGLHESDLHDVSTLISCVAAILRLWDDLGSAQDEHQNGRDGSYIECYMRDEPSLAIDEAREQVMEMIRREWKQLNKECFNLMKNQSSSAASQFRDAALNLARMVPLMYTYDHNQGLPLLKQYLQLMSLNPSSLSPTLVKSA